MFVIYYLFFRKKLKKLGEDVTKFNSSRIRFLEDSFYIIQNIKLDQSENIFIKGPPIKNTITNEVITESPVLNVKYLKTLKKEN